MTVARIETTDTQHSINRYASALAELTLRTRRWPSPMPPLALAPLAPIAPLAPLAPVTPLAPLAPVTPLAAATPTTPLTAVASAPLAALRTRWADFSARKTQVAQAVVITVVPLALLVSATRAALRGEASLAITVTALVALTSSLVLGLLGPSSRRVAGTERVTRAHRLLGLSAVVLAPAQYAFGPDLPEHLPLVWVVVPQLAQPGMTTVIMSLLLINVVVARHYLPDLRHVWRALHVVLTILLLSDTLQHAVLLARSTSGPLAPLSASTAAAVISGTLIRRWVLPQVLNRAAFVVHSVHSERNRLTTLVLTPRGRTSQAFLPGQFAWLHLDSRSGPRLWERFTISSTPSADRFEFTVESNHAMISRLLLRPGRSVYVDGPHDPWQDEYQGSLLLIADHGSVGSLLSMLRARAVRGDARPHCLVVAGRTVKDLTHRQELRALGRVLDLDVIEVLSEPGPSWTGRRGQIDAHLLFDVLEQRPALSAPHAYLCGPSQLLVDVCSALLRLGLSKNRLHVNPADLG